MDDILQIVELTSTEFFFTLKKKIVCKINFQYYLPRRILEIHLFIRE